MNRCRAHETAEERESGAMDHRHFPFEDLFVAEMQGMDGPFSFHERLLQKLWLRREYAVAKAKTEGGESIEVIHPGKWNLLGGPDFKNAHLRIGGCELLGDVEIHLRQEDWRAHGHHNDPAYDNVVLHVVLFPCGRRDFAAVTKGGRVLPTLVLLPLLLHDIEEYAFDEAVEVLANRTDWGAAEVLASMETGAVRTLLKESAQVRWRQKVRFAALRISRLGWNEACHHTALEILGYRFNRAPMLRVAGAYPLNEWVNGNTSVEGVYGTEQTAWSLQGVRPANLPMLRLRQYHEWVQANPRWPEALLHSKPILSEISKRCANLETHAARRGEGFGRLRSALCDEIVGGRVGGSRFDTLVCDGLLPLLEAHSGNHLFSLWMHWYCGDLPSQVPTTLRALGLLTPQGQPACHGLAQGLIGWMLEREKRQLVCKK